MPNSSLQFQSKPDYCTQSDDWSALPFIEEKGKNRFWQVEPTDDYGQACQNGRAYAAHFIQYLHDNPGLAGMPTLGRIVEDMEQTRSEETKGYEVGFFSYLEVVLEHYAKHFDGWACFEQYQGYQQAERTSYKGKILNRLDDNHAPVPVAVTTERKVFHSCNSRGKALFSINPGIPAKDALQEASCILAQVGEQLSSITMSGNSESLYGSALLVEAAKAIIDSIVPGVPDAEG